MHATRRLTLWPSTLAEHPRALSAAQVGSALADRNSRRVLAACVRAPVSAKEVGAATGLPLATVYRQIHRLMDIGVLVVERSAMTPDGKKYDLYRSRVREAHLDVVDDHEEVRWLPNEDVESRIASVWEALRAHARG